MSHPTPEKTVALFASPAGRKIVQELGRQNASVVLLPPAETEEIVLGEKAENALKNLADFDWIILPNVFAVDYFLQALERLGIDFFDLDALRVCAFGETVADRLRFAQVHSDVISNESDAGEVFRTLKDYEADLGDSRFLVLKEDERENSISNLLTETGAVVTELSLYRTLIHETPELPRLKALLKGGAIDEFIFTSPADAWNLAVLFPGENISDLLSDLIVSASNPAAAQSLREFGIVRPVMRRQPVLYDNQ